MGEFSIATRIFLEEYRCWNDALADRFFPRGQAQPVYLDPDRATIVEIADELGAPGDAVESFLESVKATLWLQHPRQFLRWHNEWFREWRDHRRSDIPPVVGVLALFSYASTQMQDDRGYYKPLARLLGVDDVDGIADCYNRSVRHYWVDLNRWIESAGRGIPTAYPQDIRHNVSLLLTQRFLSAAERSKLPVFFARTALPPGSALTTAEMEHHIRQNLHHLPSELMNEWDRHPERFSEVSCIEFESWTGAIDEAEEAPLSAPLLLGLYFDRRANVVQFPLATTSVSAPGGEYFLEGAPDESPFLSLAVSELGGRVIFDAGEGPRFAEGARLTPATLRALLDEEIALSAKSGFKLERGSSPAVIFLQLSANSYIEAPKRHAPLGAPCCLLVKEEIVDDAAFVALLGGQERSRVNWVGCPDGWALFRDLELTRSDSIPESKCAQVVRSIAPLPQRIVIDIRGGVPVPGPTRAGRAWLTATWPQIVVAGSSHPDALELHLRPYDGGPPRSEALTETADGHWRTPSYENAPAGDHQVFALINGEAIGQKRARFVSSNTPRIAARTLGHESTKGWNSISALLQSETTSVSGALWRDLPTTTFRGGARRPPTELSAARGAARVEERDTALEPVRDQRPERFRKRRVRRRATDLRAVTGGSLKSLYREEIQAAVNEQASSFRSADGKRWRITYFDGDEIAVQPENGFAPMARFEVIYD